MDLNPVKARGLLKLALSETADAAAVHRHYDRD